MRDVEIDALVWSLAAVSALVSWLVTVWLGTVGGGLFVVLVALLAITRLRRAK